MARRMVQSYLSDEHLTDVDDQCPMIALPSDIARASNSVKASYQVLLEGMVSLFEHSLSEQQDSRQTALALAALSVGGMVSHVWGVCQREDAVPWAQEIQKGQR